MRISRRNVIDISLLVLVNSMWAAQYAAYKVATEKMGPVTVSAWTFLMASLVLLPFLLHERNQPRQPDGDPAAPSEVNDPTVSSSWTRHNIRGFLMIGVIGLIPASVLLAWGIDRSTASNAALIYLMVPIITAILASMILTERMTLVRWLSLGISLIGVLILSDFNWRELQLANSKFLLGNVLVLLACGASSFYNVYCKGLLRRFSPLQVLVYGYVIALIVSLPLLAWVEPLSLHAVANYGWSVWTALAVLSVFSWGLAMVLWMFLLTRLDVSQASVSIYLLPFLGVLISAATLKEHITPTMIVGGLVTLAGTILITSLEPTST
jgi:drug/metabolite transporter (DMT)-like permease